MRTKSQEDSWDFSPVFDLIDSLQSREESTSLLDNGSDGGQAHTATFQEHLSEHGANPGLGNFGRLWDYLGVSQENSSPSVPHFEVSAKGNAADKEAYISDGALYYSLLSKSQRWQDVIDGHDFTDSQHRNTESLTRTQRKKRNRKLRKASDVISLKPDPESSASGDGSDNELLALFPAIAQRPLGLSKSYEHGSMGTYYASRHSAAGNSIRLGPEQSKAPPRVKPVDQRFAGLPAQNGAVNQLRKSLELNAGPTAESISEAQKKVQAALYGMSRISVASPVRPASAIHESLKKQYFSGSSAAPSHAAKRPSLSTTGESSILSGGIEAPSATHRGRHEVLPLVNQTEIDRNWSLFLKVLHNFPADRHYLVSPLQLSINAPSPYGIHVFVDASNIIIGFHEQLRSVRGIPQHARLPAVDLNFHALALLLERRRPTAKRVLAGSTPEVAAYEEARQVGYETCILDKVFKARQMTERQKYFDAKERGYASTSDAAREGPSRQPKWVEQAVDEILHLKMCESMIDTPIPAGAATTGSGPIHQMSQVRPTMVLATGDAAEAEYSPGFLKMVERALKKGWNVEVMAFKRSVSMGYRRMAMTPMEQGGWGERFKIIELDEYAEELFACHPAKIS